MDYDKHSIPSQESEISLNFFLFQDRIAQLTAHLETVSPLFRYLTHYPVACSFWDLKISIFMECFSVRKNIFFHLNY